MMNTVLRILIVLALLLTPAAKLVTVSAAAGGLIMAAASGETQQKPVKRCPIGAYMACDIHRGAITDGFIIAASAAWWRCGTSDRIGAARPLSPPLRPPRAA